MTRQILYNRAILQCDSKGKINVSVINLSQVPWRQKKTYCTVIRIYLNTRYSWQMKYIINSNNWSSYESGNSAHDQVGWSFAKTSGWAIRGYIVSCKEQRVGILRWRGS